MRKNEQGFVLILSMLMIVVLTLIGLGAMNSSIFGIKLAGNSLQSKQAFYNAESGLDLWKYDLVKGNITDSSPTDINWTNEKTYTDNGIRAVVTATHVLEVVSGTTQVKKVNGKPIYRLISHGYQDESHRITEMVFAFNPNVDPPSALYTRTSPSIKGTSTIIDGRDSCAEDVDKPGIITTTSSVQASGNPIINGLPDPYVTNSPLNISITDFVSSIKSYATDKYGTFTSGQTVVGATWGTGDATEANPKIVYYDMSNTSNPNSPYTIKLNGATGSGILLVDGDLDVGGGFTWYGIVVVTGSIKFAGGGNAITITGGILAGKDASADSDISGNINILYCSAVKDFLKKTVKLTKKLSWREIF